MLLSRYFLSDKWPLVANLIMVLDEHELFLDGPLHFGGLRAEVVLVAEWHGSYRYRHCLALFLGRLKSVDIFLAMRLQFRIASS
jgi:hypothetical protein